MATFEASQKENIDAIRQYLSQQFPNCSLDSQFDKRLHAIVFNIDASSGKRLHNAVFPPVFFDNETPQSIAKFLWSYNLTEKLREAGQSNFIVSKS